MVVICCFWRSDQDSRLVSHGEESLTEAMAYLKSTQSTLDELHKEVELHFTSWYLVCFFCNDVILCVPQCEFLQSHSSGSAVLSPCALKLAISDMSQLMTAFGHIYNTDFKGYCQRVPPTLSSEMSIFQSVHQLLHTCNTVNLCTFICLRLTGTLFCIFVRVNLNIIEQVFWGVMVLIVIGTFSFF